MYFKHDNYVFQYNMEDAEPYGCALNLEKFFNSQLKAAGMVDEGAVSKPKLKKRRL